jgi:carbon starvation protein
MNAAWWMLGALAVLAIAYRYYSAFLATRVFCLDETRRTPAHELNDGQNFHPTNKWVLFGHHFAAITGAGPLIGPVLAAQFGFLPGFLWILFGVVLAGAVHDFVILVSSVRRGGRSLAEIARAELGPVLGTVTAVAILFIIVIALAGLGNVVVGALAESAWGVFTVGLSIPTALAMGAYIYGVRKGSVRGIREATVVGVAMLAFALIFGKHVADSEYAEWFKYSKVALTLTIAAYGFIASVLPVWLLLCPRDYLSSYLKLGTIFLLVVGVIVVAPPIQMPALTEYIHGGGPIIKGPLFPFVFITIACGAISGFHALVSSGTTPKLITNETDVRLVGYGSMALESFVGIMAMIAATLLDPGVYFAINTGAGVVGAAAADAVHTISGWGFPVTVEQMQSLAQEMGESTLFARTGGAPSLAVGMASIFGTSFGRGLMSVWYHFAIMFEAVFILTTVDAGTRVGRFMVQDLIGQVWKPFAQTSWYPSILISSSLIVAGWGYFLYIGVIDPNGGINILWPLFGISNQMLACIALSVATGIIVKKGKVRYALVTFLPLAWLAFATSVAAIQKVFSADPKLGFFAGASDLAAKLAAGTLPPERVATAPQLIFNQNLDGWLTVFFTLVLWIVIGDMLRVAARRMRGLPVPTGSEAPYVASKLNGASPGLHGVGTASEARA